MIANLCSYCLLDAPQSAVGWRDQIASSERMSPPSRLSPASYRQSLQHQPWEQVQNSGHHYSSSTHEYDRGGHHNSGGGTGEADARETAPGFFGNGGEFEAGSSSAVTSAGQHPRTMPRVIRQLDVDSYSGSAPRHGDGIPGDNTSHEPPDCTREWDRRCSDQRSAQV